MTKQTGPAAATPDAAHLEQVAHVALQAGRLLLLNGADTEQVEAAVTSPCGGIRL